MNKTLNLTKEETQIANNLVLEVTLNGSAVVRNELEHKVALILVAAGMATVSKKKNYGRIAEIKNVA